jgi:hypothetical protein
MSDDVFEQTGLSPEPRDTSSRPSQEEVAEVPPKVDLRDYDIGTTGYNYNTKEDSDLGYGVGLLEIDPIKDTSTGYGIGQNDGQSGYNEDVAALQRLLITEMDPGGATTHPSIVLEEYGVDGVWRCETQAAFNSFLASKGVDGNGTGTVPSPKCPGLKNNTLDENTLELLKKKANEKKKDEDKKAKEEDATDTSVATRQKFADQCFLMSHIEEIMDLDKRNLVQYENIHLIETEDPSTLMNRLLMTEGGLDFLEIRHWELSQLTPTIRLFKQYYVEGEKSAREVEFKFNSFVDPQDDLQNMLNSQLQRGVGVGIEYFNWKLVGVQPETAKKDIQADLSIFAQNFNELFRERVTVDSDGKPLDWGGYRIIDLMMQPPPLAPGGNPTKRKYNPNSYELKVIIGWAATGGGGIISPELASALKNTQVTLFLGVEDHEFIFKDDGSVRFNVSFRARIESVMLDERSDVMSDNASRARRRERREIVRNAEGAQASLKAQKKEPCSDKAIEALKSTYNRGLEIERQQAYQKLTTDLLRMGKISTVTITEVDIEDSAEEDPESGAGTHAETRKKLTFKHAKIVSSDDDIVALEPLEAGSRNISYIYLGDIMDAAVNNVLSRDDFDNEIHYGNIKFALGPVAFDNPNPDFSQLVNINLADLPVSVELFNDFIRDKIVSKQRDSYPLLIFVRDIINDLVFEALGPDCYGGTASRGLRADSGQIIADSAAGGADPLLLARDSKGKIPLRVDLDKYGPSVTTQVAKKSGKTKTVNESKFVFKSFNNKKMSEKYNYFVIYGVDRASQTKAYTEADLKRKSRYDRDFDKGVYHLTTGLDRGLVKTMKFSKTDIPYLREARYFESDMNPDLQLSNVYNSNVTMFGNNLFYPGQRVYINPRGLGSDELGDPGKKGSYANIMGLGGYHVITRVENKIAVNGFETQLTALADSRGDGFDPVPSEKGKVGGQVIEECNFVDGAMAQLIRSFGASGVDTQAELHAKMAVSDPSVRNA